jgi:F-type H+-transporting ATPase subunit gamma
MAVNTKAVKTRINSVKNTKKITGAMQMIAAVKMKKAVESAQDTRNYSKLAQDILKNIESTKIIHPLTKKRKIDNELMIIISSNRGLCGSYNSNVFKETRKFIEEKEHNIDVIALGKKAAKFTKSNQKLNLLSLYEDMSDNPEFEKVLPITTIILEGFRNKEYDAVSIIYTNYISGLVQETTSSQILPISQESLLKFADKADDTGDKNDEYQESTMKGDEYEFEPSKTRLLDYILPMLVEVQFYQAVIESTASEHSSRMIAMKNATESAEEMIEDLNLEYNKARQASVTQEIAEISAGANALKKDEDK